jgi:hypothetical protein
MIYGFLADVIVVIHCAYIAFVLLGQAGITLGWVLKWQWVRNPWLRVAHLAAIGFVAFEAAIDMVCPLTVWENQLRTLAGQGARPGTFMGRLFHDLIFVSLPSRYFDWMYFGFAALVLATFVLCPPRFRSQRSEVRKAAAAI